MVARKGAGKIETSENIEMARRALLLSAPQVPSPNLKLDTPKNSLPFSFLIDVSGQQFVDSIHGVIQG
jgi:hypothetical protein